MKEKIIIKDTIKKVVADILYLDNASEVKDNSALFSELDLSSIDYIDLCFELKRIAGDKVTPELLWPFNQLVTNDTYFANGTWTENGWNEVCKILRLEAKTKQETLETLYRRFTVNYIDQRLKDIL